MKSRIIGETFKHPDKGMLEVAVADGGGCEGCVFDSPSLCTNDIDKFHSGQCSAQCRMDRTDVIFIKKGTK